MITGDLEHGADIIIVTMPGNLYLLACLLLILFVLASESFYRQQNAFSAVHYLTDSHGKRCEVPERIRACEVGSEDGHEPPGALARVWCLGAVRGGLLHQLAVGFIAELRYRVAVLEKIKFKFQLKFSLF